MSQLKRALDLCGIQPGQWFSVAAIRAREIRPGCFADVSQAEQFLNDYANWNQYLCGNAVREGSPPRPKATDIPEPFILLIDADPDPDCDAARATVLRMAGWMQENLGQYPTVIDSGRGTQAWVKCKLSDSERRRLCKGLAFHFVTSGVKFDSTWDPSRLMRLPGSTNLKTGRVASVIHEGSGPPIGPDALRLFPEEPEAQAEVGSCSLRAPTEAELALVMGPVKQVWDAPEEKGARSKRDFRLVLLLLRGGASEDTARALLWAMPSSKARSDGRGDDYWKSTLASVRRHMAADERTRDLVLRLPDESVEEPGAAFEPAALDALNWFRVEEGPAEWQRLRKRLKEAKVGLRALEEAMAKQARVADGIPDVELRYVANDGKRVGWFARTQEKGWIPIDGTEARATMRAQGQDPDTEIKRSVAEPWSLVNEPFQDEEFEGRRWNKDAARLAYEPKPGPHPTWDMLFDHVGHGIDGLVLEDPWCIANSVHTGGQYLLYWVAALFQVPKERLAYLFFYGEQEAGKSTWHEAVGRLMTRGYARANHAVKSKDGFNGEIANAVLCVVEEIDLSDPKRETHERIKDWVTGKTICVRPLYCQAYDLVNYTHWAQFANKRHHGPAIPGDTRLTYIFVQKAEVLVEKENLEARLAAEAPAFLHTATTVKLPQAGPRMRVPALDGADKREQMEAGKNDLEEWLDRTQWVEMDEPSLVAAFLDSLPSASRVNWDRGRVAREFPPGFRALRRLAVALRERAPGSTFAPAGLLGELPTPLPADWPGGPVPLGRALTRISKQVEWLKRVTVNGKDMWRRV